MKTLPVDSTGTPGTPRGNPSATAAVTARKTSFGVRSETFDRPWIMAEGSLEAIKWVSLVLMACDHINKFLYAETLPVVFEEGRIVMPMFGFVLAYNLARPGALAMGMHGRMMYRLLLAGLAATPVCTVLNGWLVAGGGWWPLNILFALLLVVALTYLIDRGGTVRYLMAAALFIVAGAFVEYLWMGVMCCLGAWSFCRQATVSRLILWFLGSLSLTAVNGNACALVAIPIVLMAGRLTFRLPRMRCVFYVFYPAHLLLLLGIRLEWFQP